MSNLVSKTDLAATDTFWECQKDFISKLHVGDVEVVTCPTQKGSPLEKLYITELELKIAPSGKRPVVMRWFRSENAPSTRIQSLSDCLTSVSKTLTSQEF
jgi:hypothetical protein